MSSIGGCSRPRAPRRRFVNALLRRREQPPRLSVRRSHDRVRRRPSHTAPRAARTAESPRDTSRAPASSSAGAKCDANAYGSPSAAASCAPYRLEPKIHSGTSSPVPGTASTAWPGLRGPNSACSSSTSCGKRLGAHGIAAQRAHRALVGARRASQAEIDAARIERLERAELLGDHERRVIRQHDAAGADADRARAAGDVADHDRRRGARDADHVVVLGEPEPRVAPTLGVLRELERARAAPRPAWRPRARTQDRGSDSAGMAPR